MSEVRLKKGESIDKALRRLKKKLDREGTLREARIRRNYETATEKKRRKAKEARLNFWGSFSLVRPTF
jgi:small subunit ribosomal protein S21